MGSIAQAGVRALVSAAAVLLVACGGPPEGPAPPRAELPYALRERLRAELGERYDDPLPPPTTDAIRRGAKRYDILCAGCHGKTGRADGKVAATLDVPPPDLSDPARAAFLSDRAKLHVIRHGIEGTPMVGWKAVLNEEESLDVLQFVRSLAGPREAGS